MSVWDNILFAVQDRSGTVAQLTTGGTENPVEVNDTGMYNGLNWNGTAVSLAFTVCQVNDPYNFCISTVTPTGAPGAVLQSGWPKTGTLDWLSGANVGESPATEVVAVNPANAYCTADFFFQYSLSRGYTFPESPIDNIEAAIIQASDYLDQRYRFKGIKLLQFLSNGAFDPSIGFLDPWLANQGYLGGYGFGGGGPGTNFEAWFTPSSTIQHSEWPRQGVTDYNGDNVYGVPLVVQQATCEGALRVLAGTSLQPDYDPTIVTAGGVVQSLSVEVGPIRKTTTYDTKLGLSFFPEIPHIRRMLSQAGLLLAGGGRTIIR
jgi:hypothetical protein